MQNTDYKLNSLVLNQTDYAKINSRIDHVTKINSAANKHVMEGDLKKSNNGLMEYECAV